MGGNQKKNKRKVFEKAIARNIIENTLNGTAWVFSLLINIGILTIDAFLSPLVYKDLPVVNFSEAPHTKSKKTKKTRELKEMNIRQSLWRLKRMGLVKQEGKKYFLTEAGKKLADYILKRKKAINKKWDGKYRVVIFDIPEKQSDARDWLRSELYLLNYKKLQKSVFIGKNPLPGDLIEDIKNRKIGNFVNYILADRVYKNLF